MTKLTRFLLLLVLVLLVCVAPSRASLGDTYTAATAQGSGTGVDCANARAVTFISSAGNWGAGAAQIGNGTTVHLCGTMSGSINSTLFTCQGGGASGAPVTFKFEIGANLTSAAWGDAIICTNRQWIVFDGGTNGIMQNTANGSALANKIDSAMINLDGSTHVVVKNLRLHNIYVHTGGTAAAEAFGNGIQMNSSTPLNDVLFTNNIIDNAWHGILMNYQGASSTVEISFNSFTNCGNGIFTGDRGAGNFTGLVIHDNHFTGGGNFDGGSGANHIEHIHLFGGTNGGSVSNTKIYNDIHDGDCGPHCTAFLFLEGDTPGTKVFNCIFAPINNQAQAWLVMKGSTSSDLAYNNVVDCGTAGGSGMQTETNVTTATFINNVIMNCNSAIEDFAGNAIVANNNVYFGNSCISTQFCLMSAWQAAGHDAQGQNTNPGLDSSYHPLSGSSAVVAHGSNQTALGLAELDFDAAGVARPAVGAWDVGAFQFGAAPPPSPGGTISGPGTITGIGSIVIQ